MSTRVGPGPDHPAPSQGPKGLPVHGQAWARDQGAQGPVPAQKLSNSDSSNGGVGRGEGLKDDNLHHITSV